MSHQDPDLNPAMAQALQLLHQGQPSEAEKIVRQEGEALRQSHGRESLAYASSQNDLGSILLMTGQYEPALAAFQEACRFDFPNDDQATRERLTFLFNFAHALERAGQLSQAESVLRQGLQGRERLYGRGHPGYAFGLLPLASVLLKKGAVSEAERIIEEAVEILRQSAHPWRVRAMAIRAEILKSKDPGVSVFSDVSELSDAQVSELAEIVLHRAEEGEPLILRAVFRDLLELLVDRFGEMDGRALTLLTGLANLERSLGNHRERQQAIRRVLAAYDAMGNQAKALEAIQGLALALSEAGEIAQAEQTYREAVDRAKEQGNPGVCGQVCQNFGLFLSERGRQAEAGCHLRDAVLWSEKAGNREQEGLAKITLGIFLQHQGDLESAGSLLQNGIDQVDATHPHAVMGRSHLRALKTGSSCGCGDPTHAALEAFCDFFRKQIPADLLEEVQVAVENGEMKIQVQLRRKPSEEELEMLARIQRYARNQFREHLQGRN